jgi:hypothetical protein
MFGNVGYTQPPKGFFGHNDSYTTLIKGFKVSLRVMIEYHLKIQLFTTLSMW